MNGKVKILISMAVFGTIGIFVRFIPLSSAMIAFCRGVLGCVFLLCFMAATGKKLNLQEVKRYTVVDEPETVWERIGRGFMESLQNLGNFCVELFVLLIVALPYLALIAVVVVTIILLIKRGIRKKLKKAQQKQEENPQ